MITVFINLSKSDYQRLTLSLGRRYPAMIKGVLFRLTTNVPPPPPAVLKFLHFYTFTLFSLLDQQVYE